MSIPLVCFIAWNRAGLTARNLTALLESTDDFELYIIDNNSQDDTWDYIQSIKDDRIKCKKRFDINRGLTYAENYVLSKRKKDQYFIMVENDVYIKTKDFVTQFITLLNEFPELGVIQAIRDSFFEDEAIPKKIIKNDNYWYYDTSFIHGHCMCVRPEVYDYIGYGNEETYAFDIDFSERVNSYTPFKMGLIPTIKIDQKQVIDCEECLMNETCNVIKKSQNCFYIRHEKYKHHEFVKIALKKHQLYLDEIKNGKRTAFCASVHDSESIANNYYNKAWAEENFKYFIDNAN